MHKLKKSVQQAATFGFLFCLVFSFSTPVFAQDFALQAPPPQNPYQTIEETHYIDKYFEIDQAGNLKNHIYLGDQKLADIVYDTETNSEEIFYTSSDHLGSTSVVTDETGNVVELHDYYPFGAQNYQEITQDAKTSQLFTGQEYDEETDLQYYGARYMDNNIGRFVSMDPLVIDILNADKYNKDTTVLLSKPQELNAYVYAVNNPIVYVDPTGNASIIAMLKSFVSAVSPFISNIFNRPNDINQIQTAMSRSNQSVSQVQVVPAQKTATWDALSDSRIKKLDPSVQQPAINFINNTESELGVQLRVTQGYRSFEEQDSLYWQSRVEPPTGPWVTNAKGGQSYHNYGRAIDVVVMQNGQPVWSPISQDVANIGIEQGFEWGGNWAAPYTDYPHFQMTGGQSWYDLYKSHN